VLKILLTELPAQTIIKEWKPNCKLVIREQKLHITVQMTATTTDSASTWPQHFNLLHCSNNYKNRYGTFVRFLPHKHSHFPGKPA